MSQIIPINSISIQQIQAKNAYQNQVNSPTTAEITKTFGQYLNDALTSVDQLEKTVHQKNDLYLAGKIDASELMIAANEAQLSLQLTSEVRNKMIEAYQEIMRIQV
jgi:flagellar hook-basal body complex protein FliE